MSKQVPERHADPKEAVQEAEVTRLNADDFAHLAAALDHPAPPNSALRAAARRYRALVAT